MVEVMSASITSSAVLYVQRAIISPLFAWPCAYG
jgi:hypothetical protein